MSLTDREQGAASAPSSPPAGGRRTGPTVADVVRAVTDGDAAGPRSPAYDGSAVGPADAGIDPARSAPSGACPTCSPRPGDLGMARAYVSGDLGLHGVHPGDPYEALRVLKDELRLRLPPLAEALALVRGLGWERLLPPPPPPQEALPRWRRVMNGLRHSRGRDSTAISHHYDVSNAFYEKVLGPSMTYTCAVFRSPDDTLEQAQAAKYDLVAGKLALKPGMRLLDVGLRLGRHGPARGPRVRREGARRDPVPGAGAVGAGGDRAGGADRAGRGAAPGLPGRAGASSSTRSPRSG